MPNVVRQTTSGTFASAGTDGWAEGDTLDVLDGAGTWLDGEAAAGADTLEPDPDEHADVSTANASDTTTTTGQGDLRPMPALSARPLPQDSRNAGN